MAGVDRAGGTDPRPGGRGVCTWVVAVSRWSLRVAEMADEGVAGADGVRPTGVADVGQRRAEALAQALRLRDLQYQTRRARGTGIFQRRASLVGGRTGSSRGQRPPVETRFPLSAVRDLTDEELRRSVFVSTRPRDPIAAPSRPMLGRLEWSPRTARRHRRWMAQRRRSREPSRRTGPTAGSPRKTRASTCPG